MITALRRISISGLAGFYRNLSVSLSAILVIAIALLAFVSMYLGGQILQASIHQLEKKVDVNVYFALSADKVKILEVKKQLENIDQVELVDYVTREEALENFKERNKDNQVILDSLNVLSDNPLGASFNIKAKEISQYENIAIFLDQVQVQDDYAGLIESVNYSQNKKAIDKIKSIIDYSQKFGVIVVSVLSLLALVIVYNTIRLTIYTAREEVAVMRLVGASKFFARGPFLIAGILYGVSGSVLALALLWPTLFYIAPYLQQVFVLNIYDLFISHIVLMIGSILGIGITLGLVSSILAIRRYLDI